MSAQLGLGFEVIVDPHAGDEKRLVTILGIVREFEGEDGFWEDLVTTLEVGRRLGISRPLAATCLAELRARGVIRSTASSISFELDDGASATAWFADDSPRPRAAPRRRLKGRLPLRLDEVEL